METNIFKDEGIIWEEKESMLKRYDLHIKSTNLIEHIPTFYTKIITLHNDLYVSLQLQK
jgi:hypothetical protein